MRLPYDPDPGEDAAPPERAAYRANREVRHTVIRLIGAHLRPGHVASWEDLDFDFTSVIFDGGDFSGARFSGGIVRFDGASFSGGEVSFDGAEFTGGTVSFRGNMFSGGVLGLSAPGVWSRPPEFDFDPEHPPPGVKLPSDALLRQLESLDTDTTG